MYIYIFTVYMTLRFCVHTWTSLTRRVLTLVCACDFQSPEVPMRQLLLVINFPALSEMGSLTHWGVLRWGPVGPTLTHIDKSTLLPLKAAENSWSGKHLGNLPHSVTTCYLLQYMPIIMHVLVHLADITHTLPIFTACCCVLGIWMYFYTFRPSIFHLFQ